MRFSTSFFFHESVSRAVLNFFDSAEIFAAEGAPPMSMIPVANGKNLQSEKFNYFAWTPLRSRVNIKIHFFLHVHFKVSVV